MRRVQRQRHDLLRIDWLETLQRTRSPSSGHLYSNLTVYTGERQFANSSSVHVM